MDYILQGWKMQGFLIAVDAKIPRIDGIFELFIVLTNPPE